MASILEDEFEERGVVFITVVIDDSPDAGTTVDWTDAQYWANSMDFDSDGTVDKIRHLVLADTDGGLWNRYVDNCQGLSGSQYLQCATSCPVTPQFQIFDQGGMTVDDGCNRPAGGSQCTACGFDASRVRNVLNNILPTKWCGEATP